MIWKPLSLLTLFTLLFVISVTSPVAAEAQSYDYVQYQCYPYTSYYTLSHGNHTYYKPYTTIYCLRYTYTLSVDATPGVGTAVTVSPLPSQSGQYSYSGYPYSSYGYYNPYGYSSGSPYDSNGYPYSSGTSYTTVTLTAEQTIAKDSSLRYVFVSWIIDGSETSGSNVQSLTMDRSHSVVARYKTQYMLRVSVDPAVTNLQGEGWYDADRSVNLSLPPMVQAEGQGKRYVVNGWDMDGSFYGGPSLSVQMNGPHAVKGIYKTQYYLKVGSEYGQVTGDGWYDENSSATATAKPELPVDGMWGALGAKRIFYQWSGDASGPSPTLTVRMDRAKSLTALYSMDQTIPIVLVLAIILVASLLVIGFLFRTKQIEL